MNKRVLIVDDDPSVRKSIQRVLEKAGYQVVLSADGEEAESHYMPGQIDLVLLDLNLPRQSGWDVFERLTTRYPYVPVIIITGMPNQYITARAAGVGALIEKPIDVRELLEVMNLLLAQPREAPLHRMCGFLSDTRYVTKLRAMLPLAGIISFFFSCAAQCSAVTRFSMPQASWEQSANQGMPQ